MRNEIGVDSATIKSSRRYICAREAVGISRESAPPCALHRVMRHCRRARRARARRRHARALRACGKKITKMVENGDIVSPFERPESGIKIRPSAAREMAIAPNSATKPAPSVNPSSAATSSDEIYGEKRRFVIIHARRGRSILSAAGRKMK